MKYTPEKMRALAKMLRAEADYHDDTRHHAATALEWAAKMIGEYNAAFSAIAAGLDDLGFPVQAETIRTAMRNSSE